MKVYLVRDSRSATDDMTATHATDRHLTCRIEELGHNLFMDYFFSTPRHYDDLLRRKIHSCRIVWPNRKDMPSDFGPKKLKLTNGDIIVARYNRHMVMSIFLTEWRTAIRCVDVSSSGPQNCFSTFWI